MTVKRDKEVNGPGMMEMPSWPPQLLGCKQQKCVPGNISRNEMYRQLLGWKREVEKGGQLIERTWALGR